MDMLASFKLLLICVVFIIALVSSKASAMKASASSSSSSSDHLPPHQRQPISIRASTFDPTSDSSITCNSRDLGDGAVVTKIVHFQRHGQGYHNLLGDVLRATGFTPSVDSLDPVVNPWLRPEIVDSPLTEVGKEQCRTKRQFAAQHLKPELIVVSPLTRAIQTAQLSFEDFQNSIPWIVVENTREETGMLVCNKRRPLSEVKSEFSSLTFEEGMTEEDTLFTPDRRESHESKSDRIYRFLTEFLAKREETEIAVVGHSAWLNHMLNSEIVDCSDSPELQPWFNVAEIRSIELTFTRN